MSYDIISIGYENIDQELGVVICIYGVLRLPYLTAVRKYCCRIAWHIFEEEEEKQRKERRQLNGWFGEDAYMIYIYTQRENIVDAISGSIQYVYKSLFDSNSWKKHLLNLD